MSMDSHRRSKPDQHGNDQMNPEPRTNSHRGCDGNDDEDTGEEERQRNTKPFGEEMGERPIREECGKERNSWDE